MKKPTFQKINLVVKHMGERVVFIFRPRASEKVMVLTTNHRMRKASQAIHIDCLVKSSQDRPLIFSFVFLHNSFHFCFNFSLYNFLSTAILGMHKDLKLYLCYYVFHIIEHLIIYGTVNFTYLSLVKRLTIKVSLCVSLIVSLGMTYYRNNDTFSP